MTQACQYRHRVRIERRVPGQDSVGQPSTSWEAVFSTPDNCIAADVRHQGGLESIKAGADVSTVKASIRIRYRTGIDAGMRAVHGSTIYDIKNVLPDERRREHVDLVCEAVQ